MGNYLAWQPSTNGLIIDVEAQDVFDAVVSVDIERRVVELDVVLEDAFDGCATALHIATAAKVGTVVVVGERDVLRLE